MNYIFVNKMHLIPKIVTFDKNELHLALLLLKKEGNNKNVYIVKTYKTLNLSIIFYKNQFFIYTSYSLTSYPCPCPQHLVYSKRI